MAPTTITKVTKRSGEVVDFDQAKIELAMFKAFQANNTPIDKDHVTIMADAVVTKLEERFSNRIPSVEDVQDVVEREIAAAGHFEVAKAYILYRYQQIEKRLEEQALVVEKAKHNQLTVNKHDGNSELFDVNQLTDVLQKCAGEYLSSIDVEAVVEDTMSNVYDGITTAELNQALVMAIKARIEEDPAYSRVAARVLVNDLYKEVLGVDQFDSQFEEKHIEGFKRTLEEGVADKKYDPRLLEFDLDKISFALKQERDFDLKYLGAQVLYDRYFMKNSAQRIIETPQYFFMRVAMGLCINEENREERVLEFYNTISQFYYMPSTPTLFHSGTTHPQMSSCYLTTVEDDLDNIFKSIGDNAQLSKWSGGLGNDWTNIRGTGSLIKSTNVGSQGVIPFLKIADATTAAINRSGKRRGATCAYLETWHYDIEDFLELRKNTGDDRRRTHDMNTANWIPDLFMKRVISDGDWTLFSPDETPDLHDLYGSKFEAAYEEYERKAEAGEIRLFKKMKAQALWRKMITMLFETGHPWITFKDPSNVRSPQDHVGVVHSSNLCTEITLNTSKDETAVCNLGSVNLHRHVNNGQFDKDRLAKTVKTAIRMLDNVIDLNFYPTKEAKNSNLRHRPIGLGVMGLQDALYELNLNFDTEEAVKFSDETQEMISYYAILTSSELARERGSYESYRGSKWDRDIFPLDTVSLLEEERGMETGVAKTAQLDWTPVREHVKQYGMRNSNTMAIAPTATIANISGVFPSIEPIYKNVYVKSNFSGEFTTNNPYLIADLKERGLWNKSLLEDIKAADGNLQEISEIPADLKEKYREVFELDPTWLMKHAAYRGKWIDQSQSLNIFVKGTSGRLISESYLTGWKMGLKTTYYLRSLGASAVEKSTLDIKKQRDIPGERTEEVKQEEAVQQPVPVAEPTPAPTPVAAASSAIAAAAAAMDTPLVPKPNVYIADGEICEACE